MLLPGEDGNELHHRLETWPVLMKAHDEVEVFVAKQAVHLGWRSERSQRSEDASAERIWLDFQTAEQDRQCEETRLLGLELDSDVDPEGVVRKLSRTPVGCTLLIKEMTCFQNRIDKYDILFWSQVERFFHVLGRRLRDLFTDDPVITGWVTVLLGAVYGDDVDKVEQISDVLDGLRPAWLDDSEFAVRMGILAADVPGKVEATARVRAGIDKRILGLNELLKLAEANAQHRRQLDFESGWVDDTPAGARRSNYRLGHNRSFEAALRRMDTMKKARKAEAESMEADPEDGIAACDTPATEPSPVIEAATESTVTNDPIGDLIQESRFRPSRTIPLAT